MISDVSVRNKGDVTINEIIRWSYTVFTRISAAFGTKKVNKSRPRISVAVPMRRLLEEFRIFKKPLQSDSKTALEISFSSKAMFFSSNLERSDASFFSLA